VALHGQSLKIRWRLRMYAAGEVSDGSDVAGPRLGGPALLTMDQAAKHLQISRSSLYREVGRGHLQVVKVGHLTRVRLDDLHAYVSGLATSTRSA
jgi:excisionase family DNA binding protein